MSKQRIVKELRERFSGQDILGPDQIAELIGTDHRVVKCLRAGLSLPLPTIKAGRKLGIKINDVAEWLEARETTSASKQSSVIANKRLESPARRRASLGRSLLGIKTQLDALNSYREFFEDLIIELMQREAEAAQIAEDLETMEKLMHPESSRSGNIKRSLKRQG
jgi:DNA-binding transcriptional MerR regulator